MKNIIYVLFFVFYSQGVLAADVIEGEIHKQSVNITAIIMFQIQICVALLSLGCSLHLFSRIMQ